MALAKIYTYIGVYGYLTLMLYLCVASKSSLPVVSMHKWLTPSVTYK